MQVSSTTTLSAADTADTTNRIPTKTLDQSDFLTLLTVQLQQQDPLNPVSDTESIAQMAQFSSLQEMSELNDSFSAMQLQTQLSSANSLIGRDVSLTSTDGTVYSGVVDSVEQTDSGPYLTIGGVSYPYEWLTHVAAASTSETTS